MRNFTCISTILLTTALLFAMTGCTPSEQDIVRRFFLLEVQRDREPLETKSNTVLRVNDIRISPRFNRKQLIYRVGPAEYETDYYHLFLESPAAQITEMTRLWLSQSELFSSVVLEYSDVIPTHLLEGNVVELYGDFTNEAQAVAVMTLELFVVRSELDASKVEFHKKYTARSGLETNTASALVRAQNDCLYNILTRFESDLADVKLSTE